MHPELEGRVGRCSIGEYAGLVLWVTGYYENSSEPEPITWEIQFAAMPGEEWRKFDEISHWELLFYSTQELVGFLEDSAVVWFDGAEARDLIQKCFSH